MVEDPNDFDEAFRAAATAPRPQPVPAVMEVLCGRHQAVMEPGETVAEEGELGRTNLSCPEPGCDMNVWLALRERITQEEPT